ARPRVGRPVPAARPSDFWRAMATQTSDVGVREGLACEKGYGAEAPPAPPLVGAAPVVGWAVVGAVFVGEVGSVGVGSVCVGCVVVGVAVVGLSVGPVVDVPPLEPPFLGRVLSAPPLEWWTRWLRVVPPPSWPDSAEIG